MEFTKELIEKAKECKSAEEILALAMENGYELSTEEAELFLRDFAEGELADKELDSVAGGVEGCQPASRHEMVYWETEEEVQFLFNKGDTVEAFPQGFDHHTATCRVVDIKVMDKIERRPVRYHYYDAYLLEKLDGVRTPFIKGWCQRKDIQK